MRRVLVPTAAVLGLLAATVAASPTTAAAPPRPAATEPIHSFADAVRETVFVQTDVDSDGDGQLDRVAARVIRPRATTAGLRVPVILEASPYYHGLNPIEFHDVTLDDDAPALAAARQPHGVRFPGYYDNYFVPRGYAVVLAESLGTGHSTGCPTSGGRNETLGIKAVVDWLGGRADAFTVDGRPAPATWSTGAVGMIGTSYNGTLANAVATTGVPNLRTIVPIAAISSWYDYYRANGGVLAPGGFQGEDTDVLAKAVLTREDPEICAPVTAALEREQDRATGDYSPYWDERNYLNDVRNVRASVFAVHGINDWNVKTTHLAQWWEALARQNVPRRIWLHQGSHLDPFFIRRDAWLDTLHRWFDFWLYGIDNGVMRGPVAQIERSAGQWETYESWPVPGTRPVRLRLGPAEDGLPGTLGGRGHRGPRVQEFVDNPSRTAGQLADDWLRPDPNRLVYLTEPLAEPVHLSGTPRFRIRAAVDGRSTYLTALLVDYGTARRVDYAAGLRDTGVDDCYGQGIPEDDGCTHLFEHRTHVTPYEIISRAWIDVRNRHSDARTDPVVPGRFYRFAFDGPAKDYVVPAGHRLGVVLLSTDREYTLIPAGGTRFEIDLRGSSVRLPVAEGRRELTR